MVCNVRSFLRNLPRFLPLILDKSIPKTLVDLQNIHTNLLQAIHHFPNKPRNWTTNYALEGSTVKD